MEEVERTHTTRKDIDNLNKELLGRIEGISECNMDEGIGKTLRGKCKAVPICPNRRNPPFKIKAHKVDMTIFQNIDGYNYFWYELMPNDTKYTRFSLY